MDYKMLIDLAVKYLPLIIVLLGVIVGVIKGLIRGAHKSTILLIHSAVVFVICLVLFLLVVNLEEADAVVLKLTNSIIHTFTPDSSEFALQEILGVSTECETFRQSIQEFIPKSLGLMDGLELILEDNGAYLNTLIELVLRIVFGIVFGAIHIVLTLISHLIYYICWPERRHKKKVMRLYEQNKLEFYYTKKRGLGAIIGGARALVKSLVTLSFVGTIFFIVAGGKGDEKMPELDFGDDNINLIYSAYSSICEYGTEGVYKVLNAIDDPDEVPYYLFAADLILKGKIDDIERGVTSNVYFREELSTYIGFAKDTLKLALDYGGEKLLPLINGELEKEETMNIVMDIISNPDFQAEFTNIVTTFDAKVYFINLSLSLVDSFIKNMNETNMFGDLGEAKDIMNIAFVPGYLCERIPYERELISAVEDGEYEEDEICLDYIRATSLVNESDLVEVLNIFYSYINVYQHLEPEQMGLEMIKAIVPRIRNLSIFKSNNNALNGVLRRIYAYVDYVYLTEPYESEMDISATYSLQAERYYISAEYESINWIDELTSIVDIVGDVWYLYDEYFTISDDILECIFAMFDDPKSSSRLDKIIEIIYSSRILGEVLSSQFIYVTIEQALATAIPDVYLPSDIAYTDIYTADGELIQKGELYYVLTSVRALGSTKESREKLMSLINMSEAAEISDFISTVMDLLNCRVENGDKLCNHLINSKLIQSILSAFLLNLEISEGVTLLYATDDLLQKDEYGNTINIIEVSEFESFFESMELFFEIAMPLINGGLESDNILNEVVELIKDDRVSNVIECRIIEGTISNLFISFLGENEFIVIPEHMKNGEGLISTPKSDSEIKKLINVFKTTTIDIVSLIESTDIMNELTAIDKEEIKLLLSSDILHYTISNFIYKDRRNLLADFTLVIPNSVMKNDVIEKNTIISFLDVILGLLPEEGEELDGNALITYIRENKDECLNNEIISATLSYALVNNSSIGDALGDVIVIPASLKNVTYNLDSFETGYGNTGWHSELSSVLTAFDIMLGTGDISSIGDNIITTVLSLNDYYDDTNTLTKLDKIYESSIMALSISNQLDTQIRDNNIVSSDSAKTELVLASAHDASSCFKKEEIEALLDSFVIFGITADGNNISIDTEQLLNDITDELLTYNEPCTKIDRFNYLPADMRPSTLDIIYGSAIIRSLVSDNLYDILTDENGIGLTKQYNRVLMDEYDAYNKSEVSALIKLLDILDISGDSLTNEDVNEKFANSIDVIRNNLDSLYDGSYIIGAILHKELTSNNFKVPTTSCIRVSGEYINAVTKEEANNFFIAMDELNIDINSGYDMSSFNIDELDLSILYQSNVVKYYISDLLEDTLLDMNVLPTTGYDAMRSLFKTVDEKDLNCTEGYFNKDEIINLLDFLNDVLGINLNEEIDSDPNFYISKLSGTSSIAVANRELLIDSYLIRAIISHQIMNYIDDPASFLVDSIGAHEKNGDVVVRILRYEEIESLLSIIEGDLTDYDPTSISLSSIRELIASDEAADTSMKSYILNASITEELKYSVLEIPKSTYDSTYGVIYPFHMGKLIDALMVLVGNNGVHFESFEGFVVPDELEDYAIVAQSDIMRASIASNLTIDVDTILGVEDSMLYGRVVQNIRNSNILLLSEFEVVNLMRAVKTLFNDGETKTFDISIERVLAHANKDVFNSNLICVATTAYLNNKGLIPLIEVMTGKAPRSVNVITCTAQRLSDTLVFRTDDIISVLIECEEIINGIS